jgi:NTP pyrophosphatase (non-canonical NTP hydrolase)
MHLQEFQKKATRIVQQLDAKQGVNHESALTLMHLVEEFGEIARELYNEKSGRDVIDKENLGLEIADVMILLAHLADCYNINLEKALKEKLKILKERYAHVKEKQAES